MTEQAGSKQEMPEDLVDPDRYPCTEPATISRIAAVARAQLEHEGFCALPGFMRAGAIARVLREVGRAAPDAH